MNDEVVEMNDYLGVNDHSNKQATELVDLENTQTDQDDNTKYQNNNTHRLSDLVNDPDLIKPNSSSKPIN